MSKQTAEKNPTYDALCALPDHVLGEIVNGELVATPRPGPKHVRVASRLGFKLGGPFDLGEGGPGGWWILDEPELHLEEHVLVPDLAGWRKERLPEMPDEAWFSLPPDWVCEILSPRTARLDRVEKMPIYAGQGVKHLWLVNPEIRSLDVFRLGASGGWLLASSHGEDDRVRAEPFQEVELELGLLWG